MDVGADLCVCPDARDECVEAGEHAGSPLHDRIQGSKTMTTNEYIRNIKQKGWQLFNKKLWQRNYYEHVIRNEKSFNFLSESMINNAENWPEDRYYIQQSI